MRNHSRITDCLQPSERGSMRWSSFSARGNHQRPHIHHIKENSQSAHSMDIPAPRVSPEQQQLSQHIQPVQVFDYGHGERLSPEQHLHLHHVHPYAVPGFNPASRVSSAQHSHSQHIPPTEKVSSRVPQKQPQFVLSIAVSEYKNEPSVSPEQHRLSGHVQPVQVFKYGHDQRSSPEQHLHSHHVLPLAVPRLNPASRVFSAQHLHSQHIPPTENASPRVPQEQLQHTRQFFFTAISEHRNVSHVSLEERTVATLPDAPDPQVSPEQHVLSQYAPPVLECSRSCLEFILAARTYAQMHVRIGIEETGKPFRMPPVVTTIPGSHLYNVTFLWGLPTNKTYSVNIADVGSIEKEYEDTHRAEVRRSIKQRIFRAESSSSLRR